MDPACSLVINGHSLADFIWDRRSQQKILKCGFEKVLGLESVYVHEAKHLILGVYVYDFHVSGEVEFIHEMCEGSWKHIDLCRITNF